MNGGGNAVSFVMELLHSWWPLVLAGDFAVVAAVVVLAVRGQGR